jgi:hypothetical protein
MDTCAASDVSAVNRTGLIHSEFELDNALLKQFVFSFENLDLRHA